ncbi:MAG: glycosyltransferase family 4 protein [Anaerolineae bacterium]|nr:glycosyltransferase family 4 protein [Anaerolineae bacterium]
MSSVFPPEPVVSAQTSAQIAKTLAYTNHTVTVITSFPSRPAGKIFPGFFRKLVQRERSESGVEIVRCFSTLSPESRMFSRLLENLSFGLTGGWQVLTMPRPDAIYANTWPIVATGILFMVARLRRIPLVISVQDIYPEALIAQGRIKQNSVLARLVSWIDGVIARNSAHVIVISERFADIYREQRRVPAERLSLIPNWIDSNQIDINVTGQEYRRSIGIADQDFLVVYGGNVGVAAGVETVIEAMRLLVDTPAICLLIAGSGSQLAVCQQLASTLPGERVLFHSPWAAEETSQVLRAADLLVLPTQHEQSLASVPSKLLSYMLAGRPVLATAVSGSDLADLVTHAQCGWVVETDRPDLLSAQIREIVQLEPGERQRRGANGRRYVLQHFAKDACLPRLLRILEEAGQ